MENKIVCPCCGDISQMVDDHNDIQFPGVYDDVRVDFLSYHCDSCEGSFTTTEVDEINVSRIRKAVRKYKRKDKINNLYK